jgi:lipoyl(octanoyl) transferase
MYINIIDAGRVAYREMWDRQHELFHELVDHKINKTPIDREYLIMVEHNPVYTLGKHGKPENMLLNHDLLAARGIECIPVERGGDITYHGPGQLVVYPIIDLEHRNLGVKQYVDLLEETVIRLVGQYGIDAGRVEGATGVWVGNNKICAIGIKCSRYITMHGIGLNVNTDLSYFTAINPCGFTTKGVTSIAREVGHEVDMAEVKHKFVEIFSELIGA